MPKKSDRIIIDNERAGNNLLLNSAKGIVALTILAAGLVGFFLILQTSPTAQPAEKVDNAINVQTLQVQRKDISIAIPLNGTVEAADVRQISANINGSVLDINPDFADNRSVKKGQWLIKVDTSQFKPELSQARAQLAAANAAYQTALLTMRNNNAALRELGITGSENPPQMIEARARVTAMQEQLKAVESKVQDGTVVAPYDSRILKRIVNLGDLIAIGMPLAQTLSSEKAIAHLAISDTELQLLDRTTFSQGAKLPITVSDNDGTYQWNGAIIDTEINTHLNSQLTYLIAEIYHPFRTADDSADTQDLSIGRSIKSSINSKLLNAIFELPISAVHNGNQVWTYKNGKLQTKKINIAYRSEEFIYADSGLDDGDQIITSNINLPIDGMKLRTTQK